MLESESPKFEPHNLDVIFHALGDKTRRAMLRALADGARSVSDLARPFDMTLAGASRHIRVLEDAGLIRREVRWRTHICHLEARALAEADAWLAQYRAFWTTRLDTLETLLRAEDAGTPPEGDGR